MLGVEMTVAVAEKVDRTEAARERLAAGVAALTGSAEWLQWLRVSARFHNYSFNNQMLIALQCPEATRVAGYKAWQGMGRHVRKGEHGIWILAPSTRKVTDEATGEESRRVVGFRAVPVFDVSQTEGDPLPDAPRPVLLDGQAPEGMWSAMAGMVASEGYSLERGDCGQANGFTRPLDRVVRVRDDVSDAMAARVLCHELAHVLLHADNIEDYAMHRGVSEVEAESISHIVSDVCGLPTDAYAIPYIAGWSNGKADVIAATATRVLDTSRRILAVVAPDA